MIQHITVRVLRHVAQFGEQLSDDRQKTASNESAANWQAHS